MRRGQRNLLHEAYHHLPQSSSQASMVGQGDTTAGHTANPSGKRPVDALLSGPGAATLERLIATLSERHPGGLLQATPGQPATRHFVHLDERGRPSMIELQVRDAINE